MFVETEYLTGVGAILATRRRRTQSESPVWVAHLAVVDGQTIGRREGRGGEQGCGKQGEYRSHASLSGFLCHGLPSMDAG